MATNDVPSPKRGEELRQGCWAEHEDGSLIFVYDTEIDRVVYTLFDLSVDPVMDYRHAMPIGDFERTFSCSKADINKPVVVGGKKVTKQQWLWHDKTPFPWSRVIKDGLQSVPKVSMAEDQISAAARVAKDLALRGKAVSEDSYTDVRDDVRPNRTIRDRLGAALDAFLR